ncbi:MAG: hypothetical protein IPH93_08160 [Saprospiraceae bacterium]|nr:hypothetical protein [Saprospiraceae bacterium]
MPGREGGNPVYTILMVLSDSVVKISAIQTRVSFEEVVRSLLPRIRPTFSIPQASSPRYYFSRTVSETRQVLKDH